MKPISLVVTISVLAFLLIGCNARPKVASINSHDRQVYLDAEQKLAEAATSISHSLTELASIEKSKNSVSKLKSPLDAELIGMNQLTSIDWSGPVEPLVKKLAMVCKYKLKILGTEPGIPVLVSLTAKNTPVADLLRDINFQCANKANIEIYPASKTIELRYSK